MRIEIEIGLNCCEEKKVGTERKASIIFFISTKYSSKYINAIEENTYR